MMQQLTLSQLQFVAGAGLYDHLPAPPRRPSPPSWADRIEEREKIERMFPNGPFNPLPNPPTQG